MTSVDIKTLNKWKNCQIQNRMKSSNYLLLYVLKVIDKESTTWIQKFGQAIFRNKPIWYKS